MNRKSGSLTGELSFGNGFIKKDAGLLPDTVCKVIQI